MKFKQLTVRKALVAGAICAFASSALATRSYITDATVKQIRVYGDGKFGGCTAILDVNVNDAGDKTLTCSAISHVSFDCEGTLGGGKAAAQNAFNLAQLAKVTGSKVNLYVDDGNPLNGSVCYSNFIVVQ